MEGVFYFLSRSSDGGFSFPSDSCPPINHDSYSDYFKYIAIIVEDGLDEEDEIPGTSSMTNLDG